MIKTPICTILQVGPSGAPSHQLLPETSVITCMRLSLQITPALSCLNVDIVSYFLVLYIASSSFSMLKFALYKYFVIINIIYLGVCGLV